MLVSAMKWFFPFAGGDDVGSSPVERSRVLALLPGIGLAVGICLALSHHLLAERLAWLPPRFEALGFLVVYCGATGMRTKRALGETLASGSSYLPQSISAALLPVLFLLELEFLSLIVSVRDDISFPGAGLLAVWPVVGRWASVLVSQGFPASINGNSAETDVVAVPSSIFLFLSMLLLLLFFLLFPPGLFLAPAAALLFGAGVAHFQGSAWKEISRRQIADSAAGTAETVYLFVAALLAVTY